MHACYHGITRLLIHYDCEIHSRRDVLVGWGINYLEYDGMIFRVADLTLDDLKAG